jgi:alpha-methylacyl-CoA racemase
MGPLTGLRVVEFAGLGPAPFCGMVLADLGADVLVVDRRSANPSTGDTAFFNLGRFNLLNRGKRIVALDLKKPQAVAAGLRLIDAADALIEGFRPGVMERLGLGPEACLERNPKLVYARMTGWGQHGPLAPVAGHDVNYLALSGALSLGAPPGGKPWAPPTLVGDMGGGGMLLAVGILAALHEARGSGKGQVVDAAITDGSALLATMFYGLLAAGVWRDPSQPQPLDSTAPSYDTYRCADGGWISLGSLERPFFERLAALCDLGDDAIEHAWDPGRWPAMKARVADVIARRTRDEWCALLEGTDICFAPVLDPIEATAHPHNRARATFATIDGVVQPAPAPRFSRTPAATPAPPPARDAAAAARALAAWGLGAADIDALRAADALG